MDDFWGSLTEEAHGHDQLCTDQLMIGTQHIDDPVKVPALPGVVGKVTGCIDRGAITPPEHIFLLEPGG